MENIHCIISNSIELSVSMKRTQKVIWLQYPRHEHTHNSHMLTDSHSEIYFIYISHQKWAHREHIRPHRTDDSMRCAIVPIIWALRIDAFVALALLRLSMMLNYGAGCYCWYVQFHPKRRGYCIFQSNNMAYMLLLDFISESFIYSMRCFTKWKGNSKHLSVGGSGVERELKRKMKR